MTYGPPNETTDARGRASAPLLLGILLSAAAWIASCCIITATLPEVRTPFSLEIRDWVRSDAFNYLKIADHGRFFGHCGEPNTPRPAFGPSPGRIWCGSAGWLPGYPYTIRAVSRLGLSPGTSALLIARFFAFCAMFLVWWGWLRKTNAAKAFLVLLLFGTFPGAVYNFAIFPISGAIAFFLLAIVAAEAKHMAIMAGSMVIAGLFYPSIWFAVFGLSFGLFLGGLRDGISIGGRRAFWGMMGILSLAVLGLIDWNQFGHPDAYFLVQQGPGTRQSSLPGALFLRVLTSHQTVVQRHMGPAGGYLLAVQTALVVGIVTTAAVISLRGLRRAKAPLGDICMAACGCAIVAGLILHGNEGAWNRSVAVAAPSIVCLRHLPPVVLLVLLVGMATLTALISQHFFAHTFV